MFIFYIHPNPTHRLYVYMNVPKMSVISFSPSVQPISIFNLATNKKKERKREAKIMGLVSSINNMLRSKHVGIENNLHWAMAMSYHNNIHFTTIYLPLLPTTVWAYNALIDSNEAYMKTSGLKCSSRL